MEDNALRLEPVDLSGLERLYPLMEVDFPIEELKPLDKMRRLMRQGLSVGWRISEGGSLRGYAFLIQGPGQSIPLLDYFAMLPALRGQGYGSRGLELLKKQYPEGFFLEAEDPADASSDEEKITRRRRVAFYQRAGLVPCPFPNRVFGVQYLILLWMEHPPIERNRFAARLEEQAYRCHLSEAVYDRRVSITVPEA
ncbi:MAG: GNAT family N-acetyltransferase [Oscillospiraceae bacterium]|nr:GNAT family N-acetyltransferase [Oscillospiraceae bacterium]